jgi:phage major head subunit gpT-like protein
MAKGELDLPPGLGPAPTGRGGLEQGQLRAAEERIALLEERVARIFEACRGYEQVLATNTQQMGVLMRREVGLGMWLQSAGLAAQALGSEPLNRAAKFKELAEWIYEHAKRDLAPQSEGMVIPRRVGDRGDGEWEPSK